MTTSALSSLAQRCGITASYRDARGQMRDTSAATQRALLAAMGTVVPDEQAAQAALLEMEKSEWDNALPPVCVIYRGAAAPSIDVNLPAMTQLIRWSISLEDGGEHTGKATFASLELLARQETSGGVRERRKLLLDGELPVGYHQFNLDPACGSVALIVTPGKCWLPPRMAKGERLWGLTAQLYLLRSAKNWGIGDYTDLTRLVKMLIERGANVLGLNPLHAMFIDEPEHASPYSPESRLLLNVLNIDVDSVDALRTCAPARACIESEFFQAALRRLRESPLVMYREVLKLKLPVLQLLFDASRANPDTPQWQAFEKFQQSGGQLLWRGCVFETLREYFAKESPETADWHRWPAPYRDPKSAAVAEFAHKYAQRVAFHEWLQFVADSQLGAAAQAAGSMAVGLYRDLAIGADRSGAETWANQIAVVADAQVGAPPDIYNPGGQDWGLPPFNPRALYTEAYRSFIDIVRANMRHAGGLRIDHVMGLQQLYWVPHGQPPANGAYVRYPLEDLVGILALESQRNKCLVVGEDLGTVPEGFRERMADAGILSYKVLFFEKNADGFIPPDRYPPLALAVAGSHDLPTLRGWWEKTDLKLKSDLNLFPTLDDADDAAKERDCDKREILEAFRRAGLSVDTGDDVDALIRNAHAYLGCSTAMLAMAQIDDITDESLPVNVPTTSYEHPNWRRRLSLTLEQLIEHPRFAEISEIFCKQRGSHVNTASVPPV